EVEPIEPVTNPVSLERIRADAALKDFQLVTRGRLSVVPVTPGQYARVLGLSLRPEAPAPATPRKRSSRSRSATRRKRARCDGPPPPGGPRPGHAAKACLEEPERHAPKASPLRRSPALSRVPPQMGRAPRVG